MIINSKTTAFEHQIGAEKIHRDRQSDVPFNDVAEHASGTALIDQVGAEMRHAQHQQDDTNELFVFQNGFEWFCQRIGFKPI